MPQTSFLALIVRAFRLLVLRFPLYAGAVVAGIALDALCSIVLPIPHGLDVIRQVATPLVNALVYAFVWNDDRETPLPARAAWERFLERAWAVILIDFVSSAAFSIGLAGSFASDATSVLIGFLAVGLALALLFADAAATVDDDGTVWLLLPRAFVKSVAVVANPRVLIRAVAILALQVGVFAAQSALDAALTSRHVPFEQFWAFVPLDMLTAPPLAALVVLVYLDAVRPVKTT